MYIVTSKPKRMSLYSGVSHFMILILIFLVNVKLFPKAAIYNADPVPAFEENKYTLKTKSYNHVEKSGSVDWLWFWLKAGSF
jgi:hypothetical protein